MSANPANTSVDARKKSHEFFISTAVKGAEQIRKKLRINDDTYSMIHTLSQPNARGYYIYGVLDEVEKASSALMLWSQFIIESSQAADPAVKTRKQFSTWMDLELYSRDWFEA